MNDQLQSVYILECADKSTYVGCTSNLNKRLERHEKGFVDSTKDKLPVRLLFEARFPEKYRAFLFEKYLKSGSGRAFMFNRLIAKE